MKKLNVYDIGPESQLSNLTIIFKVYFRNLELLGLQIFKVEGRSLLGLQIFKVEGRSHELVSINL
jgi:hypothetical protein